MRQLSLGGRSWHLTQPLLFLCIYWPLLMHVSAFGPFHQKELYHERELKGLTESKIIFLTSDASKSGRCEKIIEATAATMGAEKEVPSHKSSANHRNSSLTSKS